MLCVDGARGQHEKQGLTRRSFVAGSATAVVALRQARVSAAPQAARALAEPVPVIASPVHEATIVLAVNGSDHALTLEPRVTLLDALRDRIGLTGTKKGCDQGTCGACTVLVNERRINSCLTLAVMHEGDRITTVEGLATASGLHPLQRAFIEHDAFQCGYCTPGQLCSAVGFSNEGHPGDRATVQAQMSGNICRCGCYPHIVDAILEWRANG
jgi:xanthine dehydrogenase YagT iron-sulfur-binding subunit